MRIYDRWGNFVYETDQVSEGWDGTHDGTRAQDDVYIYHIKAEGLDGKLYNRSGDVTLIKWGNLIVALLGFLWIRVNKKQFFSVGYLLSHVSIPVIIQE